VLTVEVNWIIIKDAFGMKNPETNYPKTFISGLKALTAAKNSSAEKCKKVRLID